MNIKSSLTGPTSYSNAAQTGLETSLYNDSMQSELLLPSPTEKIQELCPFALKGECRYAERCTYRHGDICSICGKMALLPGDEEQNQAHEKVCTFTMILCPFLKQQYKFFIVLNKTPGLVELCN